MNMDGLLHAAWDKKLVREFCDLSYLPSIFESLQVDADGKFKLSQTYIDGKKKADALFDEIMSSPEKIQRVVAACTSQEGDSNGEPCGHNSEN